METESIDTGGEESLDSIPRPEYEAIEPGATSTLSSPTIEQQRTLLHGPKKMDIEMPMAVAGDLSYDGDVDMQSEDIFSEKQDSTDGDEPDEQLLEEYDADISAKSYSYGQITKCNEEANSSALVDSQEVTVAPMVMQVVSQPSTPKMVHAKTKDNKFLLVQLVGENGKTFTPSNRNASNSEIVTSTAVSTGGPSTSSERKQMRMMQQPRSSTPLSREYVALQKSVNASKILTGFVTDGAVEKARKRRKSVASSKDASSLDRSGAQKSLNESSGVESESQSKPSNDSYWKTRRKSQLISQAENNVTADSTVFKCVRKETNDQTSHVVDEELQGNPQPQTTFSLDSKASNNNADTPGTATGKLAEKARKPSSSKFVPLRDESSTSGTSDFTLKRRSRSKSVSRKSIESFIELHSSSGQLKKWPSEGKISKRTNMRSQNSDFVQKQMDFLNRVIRQEDDEATDTEEQQSLMDETDDVEAQLADRSIVGSPNSYLGNFGSNTEKMLVQSQSSNSIVDASSVGILEKYLEEIWQPPPKRGCDSFCWKCRQSLNLIPCSKCPRAFHHTCIKTTATTKLDKSWVCPECVTVENILNGPKRARRNDLSLDLLSQLLSFALKRMRNVKGLPQFLESSNELLNYSKYFVNPVTFATLQEKIEKKLFRCAEEFVNETKWMHHNALIAAGGTANTKDTITAKGILKICRQEVNEIETCAECYLNANTRSDWFVDVCSQPHLLVWAKLKGFPYWPAKAMGVGQSAHVNVRFFGEHDRAFVPSKDCYLFSEQVPNAQTGKRSSRAGFAECIQEVELHIEKIRSKIGAFKYAPYKTLYDPSMEMQQLEMMMPGVQEYIKRQQTVASPKPPLQYKIVKTADNHLSIIKKASTVDSGTESDHSLNVGGVGVGAVGTGSPSKKKVPENPEADVNKAVKNAATSNYEVISKISSDDSNSSKVSTVILKRKADNSGIKSKGDDVELPMPKMSKIEENPDKEPVHRNDNADVSPENGNKDDAESPTPKVKHSKHDPKVPVLTIKTTVNKIVESKALKEGKTVEQGQSAVENLVKFKPGVTIKKIPKEDVKRKAVNLEKSVAKPSETPDDSSGIVKCANPPEKPKEANEKPQKVSQNKSKPSNPPSTSKVNIAKKTDATVGQKEKQIIKDLIPFIEIKKEITSEDEAEKERNELENAVAAIADPIVNPPPENIPSSELMEQPHQPLETPFLLTVVKQEVMSDEETPASETVLACDGRAADRIDMGEKANSAGADSVRVIGETTIQKRAASNNQPLLSVNNTQSADIAQISASNPSVPGQLPTSTTQSVVNGSKRGGARGIPYGPLPASATSAGKSATTAEQGLNAIEKQQLRQNQRARKSFPNRSPPEVSPTHSGAAAPQSSPSVPPVTIGDPKRTLTKTSMVSIPVDVAANRGNSAIPVPPLTAVTKVTPTTSPSTAVAACAALPSPAVSTSAASSVFVNCNGTTPLAMNSIANNPIAMSVPPPLAGLSYSTFTSTSSSTLTTTSSVLPMNCSDIVNNNPVIQSSAASNANANANADSHLLGDFVTPSLASAITEVICRGPPRMAPRPNGPLQSDGSAMFPSQAGPVCRTLVENAHKLTDFFISVMEDTMCEMSVGEEPVLQAKITLLTMELERTKQTYEREIAELKRTSDLMLCEMRKSMESEKTRITAEVRRQCELERLRSVEDTKKKQWCANCGREAQFYCCWNTSYCDYPCQQLHWSRHASSCAQTRPVCNDTMQTGSSSNINTGNQVERHHSSGKSSVTNSSAHYNAGSKSVMSNKKDKSKSGNLISNALPSSVAGSAEVLKLPTNTYLRPVANNSSVRNQYAPQVPVQRFNIPLPIAAPANPGLPYTLVQREGNWELMSTATTTVTATNPVTASNSLQANAVNQQAHSRLGGTSSMSSKTPRNRSNNTLNAPPVTMQAYNTNLSTSLQCGSIRPAQI